MGIYLWLDDERDPDIWTGNIGWTWVTSIRAAKMLLETAEVDVASLDNDLGPDEPEGYQLVLWMAEFGYWPTKACRVHTANPVRADYMRGMIERYGPYG